jgi:tetratricopeptide (TPR) repeat protein
MAAKCLFVACCLFVPFLASAADAALPTPSTGPVISIQAAPALDVPLGESARYFSLGGSAAFRFGYHLPGIPAVSVLADLGYSYDPLLYVSSTSRINVGVGVDAFLALTSWFGLGASVTGGYYHGFLNDPSLGSGGGNPYVNGAARVSFRVMPSLTIDAGAAYLNCFGLYSAILPFLGSTLTIGEHGADVMWPAAPRPAPLAEPAAAPRAEALSFEQVKLIDVFPVFYKYYDNHPIGSVKIRNSSTTALDHVRVSTSMGKFMDAPKDCAAFATLAPGESRTVDLYALLNDKVLEVTESTKVAVEIIFEYTQGKGALQQKKVETIRLLDRNALTWEDDRRVAAFVSYKDPAVLGFSKNIVGMTKGKGSTAVNQNLLTAMAFHEALSLYGLSYVADPETPYAQKSASNTEVDNLQFPRHTLEYHAGDCDDLSILYCALMESVGIETAFITVPGHIYMAFTLAMDPEQAKKSFFKAEDLIFQGGKTWVPVEITMRTGGFLAAWQEGAREWRESSIRSQAAFLPVHEAWKLYEPVGLPGTPAAPALPSTDKVVSAYLQEVVRFIDREIYIRAAKLQGDIQNLGETPARLNQLGVLYAKYGLYDRAEVQFKKAAAGNEYVPALVNLGTAAYLVGDNDAALGYYQRAAKKAPDDPGVLLGIARVSHDLENYGEATRSLARLKQVDPALADKFAYIELKAQASTRGADVTRLKGEAVWSGDE